MGKKKKKITKAILKKREKRLVKRNFNKTLNEWKVMIIDRDKSICQKCKTDLVNKIKHPHHIIALQAVKRKYVDLLDNVNNGILLCPVCHKWASDSPHQGGFEFTLWLEKNKPDQYLYLKEYLRYHAN